MSTDELLDPLPRWSVADLYESLDSAEFRAAVERIGADIGRLTALFDEHDVRAVTPRPVTSADSDAADAAIRAYNRVTADLETLQVVVYSAVSTDSRDELATALFSQLEVHESVMRPLLARLADWLNSLGVDQLAGVSIEVAEHLEPLRRLALRADHQMSESDELLFAELSTTGSGAWARLHEEVTSQLTADVELADGPVTMPIAAVRGLASAHDANVREAAYLAELAAWPRIETPIAAALNAIKGEANVINRRRKWASPLDASLYANSVSRATFDAMQSAVVASLPDFRRWMRRKAALHGYAGGLRWSDLIAPLPHARSELTWDEGIDWVRSAFGTYSGELAGLVNRALDESWIDASPRPGKVGGAFCMNFVEGRSLVLLNWAGSIGSAQTTAHELGHAYHNVTLAGRTALQRRLPMALAETASIFCETLAVNAGLRRLEGVDRLALLDMDLSGATQVVVDIHSRFLFETELFARRQRRTVGVRELNEMMLHAQDAAYGDGLDPDMRHPYMWLLKSHYYGSHFYNWPYTYGFLFGLGLFAVYQEDPDRFRGVYADALSRAGIDSAEELGQLFGIDVTREDFWVASLDVCRDRMAQYNALAAELPA